MGKAVPEGNDKARADHHLDGYPTFACLFLVLEQTWQQDDNRGSQPTTLMQSKFLTSILLGVDPFLLALELTSPFILSGKIHSL